MIIVKDKFCFIHIPKTSGSSFTKIISKHCETKKIIREEGSGWQGSHHFNSSGKSGGQHTSINELKKDHLLKIKDLPVITIVRNPYSWIISIYENFVNKGNFKMYLKSLKKVKKVYGNKKLQIDYINNIYDLPVNIYKFEENPHREICKEYGLEFQERHLTSRNRTKKIKDYYDQESLKIVNSLFKLDFEHLNYKMISSCQEFDNIIVF